MRTRKNRPGKERPRKHLLWIVPLALAALLVGGWFGVTLAVESAARRCLADTSVRLLGYEVVPDKLSCSLIDQELCIEGIRVENPPGYSDGPALEVDLIRVRVNPLAFLFDRVIHLKKLTISGVRFNVEMKKTPMDFNDLLKLFRDREINLLELKRNDPVSERRAVKRKKRSRSRRTENPLKFRIDELRVEKVAATLHNYKFVPEKWRKFTLDSYVQKDLGRDVPLTADELAREIFNRHWEDIKKHLKNKMNMAKDWWKGLFGKKPEKETVPARTAAQEKKSK